MSPFRGSTRSELQTERRGEPGLLRIPREGDGRRVARTVVARRERVWEIPGAMIGSREGVWEIPRAVIGSREGVWQIFRASPVRDLLAVAEMRRGRRSHRPVGSFVLSCACLNLSTSVSETGAG